MDTGDPRVPWRASDVLDQRTGLCYAKSHAYVALLRAGGIQAGLCYQESSGILHGLTAALVDDRWVLLDPRGNKPGIDVQFSPSENRLAYPDDPIHPTVYAEPRTPSWRASRPCPSPQPSPPPQ